MSSKSNPTKNTKFIPQPKIRKPTMGGSVLPTGSVNPVNTVQSVKFINPPTGGNFKLLLNGVPTDLIYFNASPDRVKKALESLPEIGNGNVKVTGTNPWKIEFIGTLAGKKVNKLTMDTTEVTGSEGEVDINQNGVPRLISSSTWSV